jgi:hypothetical protein
VNKVNGINLETVKNTINIVICLKTSETGDLWFAKYELGSKMLHHRLSQIT